MLINPSRDVFDSLACCSYSKSVRLGEFKSVENVTPGIFFEILELKYERKRVLFSPYDFFFILSINTCT